MLYTYRQQRDCCETLCAVRPQSGDRLSEGARAGLAAVCAQTGGAAAHGDTQDEGQATHSEQDPSTSPIDDAALGIGVSPLSHFHPPSHPTPPHTQPPPEMPFDAARYPLGFKSLVEPMDKDLVSVSLASDSSDASGPTIFHITLLAAQTPDNRLTPQFLTALLAALEHVESQWDDVLSGDAERGSKQGAALVLSSVTQGPSSKFFSNGLDFESAIRDPTFFDRFLFPVYDKLLTFPIPTVASLGGHAFAAGFGLSCACDYAVMGKKGYMCMNEVS